MNFLTPLIKEDLNKRLATLDLESLAKVLPKLSVTAAATEEKTSFEDFDFDRYVGIKVRRRILDINQVKGQILENIISEVCYHLLGYHMYKKSISKSVMQYWWNIVEESLTSPEAKAIPQFVAYLASAIDKAAYVHVPKNKLMVDKANHISLENPLDLTKREATFVDLLVMEPREKTERGTKFILNCISILGRDTIYGEILTLLLNGVSRKDFRKYLCKFGVNNRGGIHSKEVLSTVKVLTKDDLNRPLTKRMASQYKGDKIDIVITPKYGDMSLALLNSYVQKLKVWIREFWNSCEALNESEKMDAHKELGTQFLNLGVTRRNKAFKYKTKLRVVKDDREAKEVTIRKITDLENSYLYM